MFIVTGGGSGIGKALALELAKQGKQVLIIGRRGLPLKETATYSSLITYCCANVATAVGRQEIVDRLASVEQLEGLIHNAGIIEPILPIMRIDECAWQQTLETNLNAPLFLSQLLLPKLKQGRILHIGSGAAHFPVKGWAAYCVSKAALAMLTQCWQQEVSDTFFASVMPGIIDTDMQDIIRNAEFMDSEKLAFFKTLYVQKKLISVETVAKFLRWLLTNISGERFVGQEWDIYDIHHHPEWLRPPHIVPSLE